MRTLQYPQHTTEWAIPYENSQACLRDFREYLQREQRDPHGVRPHFPIEIRFSAPDNIWLSPSYGRRTCWIGIVQYKWVFCLFSKKFHCLNFLFFFSQGLTVSTYPIVNCSKHSKKSLVGTRGDLIGPNLISCSAMTFGLYIFVSTTSPGFSI